MAACRRCISLAVLSPRRSQVCLRTWIVWNLVVLRSKDPDHMALLSVVHLKLCLIPPVLCDELQPMRSAELTVP